MYKLELEKNTLADCKYFQEWLDINFSENIGFAVGSLISIYFETEPSETDKLLVSDFYSGLEESDKTSFDLEKLYQKRSDDGIGLYSKLRSNLVKLFHSGDLSISGAHFIEKKLMFAKSFLLSGDWATAQYELGQIEVEGDYTQEIHDAIKSEVDDYVNNNYL
jgi:hypothetical protein